MRFKKVVFKFGLVRNVADFVLAFMLAAAAPVFRLFIVLFLLVVMLLLLMLLLLVMITICY